MDVVVASTNKNKIKEIRSILKGLPINVLSPADFGVNLKIAETGKTFKENAIKKAKVVVKRFDKVALADDSGLMVQVLKGAPGIKSARFAGPYPTTKKLCNKLLKIMKTFALSNRKAKFICDIAVVEPKGKTKVVEGICKGKIAFKMRGRHGFGYDPVFIPEGFKKTFAEMSPRFKNRISHRARALKKARALLKKIVERR